METTCLFCKIIKGDIPAKKISEDDEVLAFWDIAPQAPQHLLVIPKKHLSGPAAMSEDDEEVMAIRHHEYPLEGVQFHPESILTWNGKDILHNFLRRS